MGRSISCFKIITCAGDSADDNDFEAPENKSSSDKRGWSFRKRSARHRVLSNTVIKEPPYSANKGSPESANFDFQSPDTSTVPEKISVKQCTDEKPQLPTSADSKVSESIVVTEDGNKVDARLEESLVIVIQTAVRGFLAQRELIKLKNLVKLQAAVRGHLVRQHAIGSLRCVQAIVKMQVLVRARHARLLQERSSTDKKIDGKCEKANSKTSGKETLTTKPINVTYTSINKLLSNKFACQLMESTPKKRPIHIKCDPAKPNSAWNWLERWMSVSSAEPTPQPESRTEQLEGEKNGNLASQDESAIQSEVFSEVADSESSTQTNAVPPSETEENLIVQDTNDFKFQECYPTSSLAGDNLEKPQSENSISSDIGEPINCYPNQTVKSESNPQMEIYSLPVKEEAEGEQTDQPKLSMKRLASEPLETEGKKFVFGSRKASNPSFIATHSKFEELSSTANSNRSLSSYQNGESKIETASGTSNVTRTKELSMVDNLVPNNFRAQHGGSECGTELSVTSTLDSPDMSEVAAAEPEYEHDVKSSDKEICNSNIIEDAIEARNPSSDPVSNLSDTLIVQPEKHDGVIDESVNSIVAGESPSVELKPDRSASDVQREMDSENGGDAYRTSPEPSPRSPITIPESQGTPSSQLSVNGKKNRTNKSNKKCKSLSANKRSPPNPNSGARNSVEQLPKDQKNGKRRNSFGSTRSDHTDQEPRESGSNSSVPHFMQATESARAKIQANDSPRSSPDVHDREYAKKRHSLPGANGRQGSPHIQRSISQAQPVSKGNGSIVVHEKKWQR